MSPARALTTALPSRDASFHVRLSGLIALTILPTISLGIYQASYAAVVFMPHLGFEVVPGRQRPLASELQRRTAFEVSFAAEHQRRTASQI